MFVTYFKELKKHTSWGKYFEQFSVETAEHSWRVWGPRWVRARQLIGPACLLITHSLKSITEPLELRPVCVVLPGCRTASVECLPRCKSLNKPVVSPEVLGGPLEERG